MMNRVPVSLTERTKEIGWRMAIGARRSSILLQFPAEAVTLSLVGGLVGVVTGTGVVSAYALGYGQHRPISIPPHALAISSAFSAVLGVAFSLNPAWTASRLDPFDALHHE